MGSPGRLYVGTSGFAYPEWVGPFYPPGTRRAGMLRHYATRFPTVEVNYTFRRLPAPTTLAGWREQTPEGFAFGLKANQGITHHARLVDVDERLSRFLGAVAPLAERLGPILFQCPPNLRYDPGVLDAFLSRLSAAAGNGASGRLRFAMEFRHPSFDTDEVRGKLDGAGVAWCAADTEETPASFVRTAPAFAYLRLRRGGYDAAGLARWAEGIVPALAGGTDVYAYFKHEDSATGPRDAEALQALVAA